MAHFYQVTESDLRNMARSATALFMEGSATPTDAAIKVASASGHSLTSEHVQRVCEMMYHDIYERSFNKTAGQDRVVNFDPPDARKVAAAVNAERLHSFGDKIASRAHGGAAMDKTASAPLLRGPREVPNAFARSVSAYKEDAQSFRKEARHILSETRNELFEAVHAMRTDIDSMAGSEKLAFMDLSGRVLNEVRQGASPVRTVMACVEFVKSASDCSEEMLTDIATDLVRGLSRAGVDIGEEKTASLNDVVLNDKHPLRAVSIKVAELRAYREHALVALSDLETQLARVERESRNVVYQ